MTVEERLREIEERANKATHGPWQWNVNRRHKQCTLESRMPGKYVMDFVRWGMHGSQPRFNIEGLMKPCGLLVEPRQPHRHDWDMYIDHPDAEFIAHAREDISWLLETIKDLTMKIDNQRQIVDSDG